MGEAGPEAVMPLKRSKDGLGIETSAGITAPLKRLASGNLGIDSSLFDGGSMKNGYFDQNVINNKTTDSQIKKADKKFASGGLITEPVLGTGLISGSSYAIAENGPEIIIPQRKNKTGESLSISVPISIQGDQNYTQLINRLREEIEDTAKRVVHREMR